MEQNNPIHDKINISIGKFESNFSTKETDNPISIVDKVMRRVTKEFANSNDFIL
jgi:hypothetical protein